MKLAQELEQIARDCETNGTHVPYVPHGPYVNEKAWLSVAYRIRHVRERLDTVEELVSAVKAIITDPLSDVRLDVKAQAHKAIQATLGDLADYD